MITSVVKTRPAFAGFFSLKKRIFRMKSNLENSSESNNQRIKSKMLNPALTDFSQYSDTVMIRPQVAKIILGVSISTLWRLIRDNKLKARKLTERTTVISVGDLRAFINKNAEE